MNRARQFLNNAECTTKNTIEVGVLNRISRSKRAGNDKNGHTEKNMVYKSRSNELNDGWLVEFRAANYQYDGFGYTL